MKIMKKVYLSFLTLLLISCSLSDSVATCTESRGAPVETVVEKESADATKHLFDVAFRVSNSCGNLESFEQSTQGNITTVYIKAKYDGCTCTQETQLRNAVYTFDQTVPGTYTLRFKMIDNNYVTKTIVIE